MQRSTLQDLDYNDASKHKYASGVKDGKGWWMSLCGKEIVRIFVRCATAVHPPLLDFDTDDVDWPTG